VNERERGQLQGELATEREALLAVVSAVEEQALTWPTRNPGWAVRDVLAHVLASDADLISLVEVAGRSSMHPLRLPGLEEHQREMARWTDATLQAFAEQLRERGDRWQELLAALPRSAFAIPATVYWGGGMRTLADVVADWRGHYPQHAEDVRLALADGPADPSERPRKSG
jgi:uncharacterized protein (TIGR03083 family)